MEGNGYKRLSSHALKRRGFFRRFRINKLKKGRLVFLCELFEPRRSKVNEIAKVKLITSGNEIGAWVQDGFHWQGKPEKTVILPINKIDINEPDSKFDDAENAANLKSIQKALKKGKTLPPILVRRVGMRFQIIDGHHRFKAYKSLGMKKIPARIVHASNITESFSTEQMSEQEIRKAMLFVKQNKLIESAKHFEIERIAKPFQDQFEEGHVAAGPASLFTWSFDPNFPIDKIAGKKEILRYFESDKQTWAEDGDPHRFDDMNEEIYTPVVLVRIGGLAYLWDGNHRVGASILNGRTEIPAYVGVPKH